MMAGVGLGVGANISLSTLIIVEVMGADYLAPVYGVACSLVAVGFVSMGPVVGNVSSFPNFGVSCI